MSEISRSEYGMRDLSQMVLTAQNEQNTSWATPSLNEHTMGNSSNAGDSKSSADREKLIREIDRLNDSLKDMGKSLRFKFNDKTQEFYVEVLDSKSQEVVETLPPKYLMDLEVKMKEIVGLHVDKKI
jgi:flagellar protein FlaG